MAEIIESIVFEMILVELMVAAFMIFDYTKALPALAFAVGTWISIAAVGYFISWWWTYQRGERSFAGWIWLWIAILCIANVLGFVFFSSTCVGEIRGVAKGIGSFLEALGGKVPWGGSRIKFAWVSLLACLLMIGFSFYMMVYWENA